MEELAQRAPQFGYQVQLASGEVETKINTPEKIRQFLHGMYGGRTAAGRSCLSPRTGIIYEALGDVGPSPLFSDLVSCSPMKIP